MERIWLVKRPHLEFSAHAREGLQALLGPDQNARVAVGAPDAPHGDVRRVAHEVRALVAALEGRAVEVPDRLLEDRLPSFVLDDELPPDDVHPANLVQVHAPLVPNLLEHQFLVVEALGAEQGDSERDRLYTRRPPRPGPRLHRLYALDLARRTHHRDPGVRRQLVAREVDVRKRERLVVEAPGALPHLLGCPGEEGLPLPRLLLALPRHQRPVYLPRLEQGDEQGAHHPAVLSSLDHGIHASAVALVDAPDALYRPGRAIARDLEVGLYTDLFFIPLLAC